MRRRDFIKVLGGAAVARPMNAHAQRSDGIRLIGVLATLAESDSNAQRRFAAFKEGMRKLDWIEGENVRYEVRWGAGESDRVKRYAQELVQLAPDVILTNGTPPTAALHRETKTIPIVFAVVSDPVGDGFVASLARPGGNITGFITFYPEIVGKWIETLKEIAPHIKRVALLFNPRTAPFAGSDYLRPLFESAARRFSIEPITMPMKDAGEIKTSIDSFARTPGGGLLVMPDGSMIVNRATIFERAAHHGLPAIYPFGYMAANGGLIAYGVDVTDLNRRAASYVDRILKGAKPADLPVQAPTAFELVINLKTAKALGLTVPPTLLARADGVIE